MIKQQFNNLLQKEMDRKDFLKYSGGVVLAAVGVTGMVKLLLGQAGISLPIHGTQPQQPSAVKSSAMGYGGSAYGR